MESEPQLEKASLLARQPSGIRALPSHDDDDDDDDYGSDSDPICENNNSPGKIIENVEKTNNSTSNSSSSNSSFTSGSNGSFVSGEEEFETPLGGVDEETPVEVGQNGGPAARPLLGLSARKAGVPIAKVSVTEDDDENETGVDGEEDGGDAGDEVGSSRVYGVGSAPKVRVLGDMDVVGENIDVRIREEPKVESVEVKADQVEGVEENGSLNSAVNVEGGGLELTEEGVAVVDSIHIDAGEAVRSGAAVVGVENREDPVDVGFKNVEADEVNPINEGVSIEESTNVDVVEPGASLVAEEVEERKDPEVGLRNEETCVVEESVDRVDVASADSVVDSIHVDVGEAVRSGVAIVSEVEEAKDSESAPVVEDSAVDESDPADSTATEIGVVKSTGEDSMIDGIHVDAGVALVGDSGGEGKGMGVKEVGAPVVENVALVNEFEPLLGSNTESVTNNGFDSAEHEEHKEGQLSEPLDIEEIKPENDIEPAGGVRVASGGNEDKIQPHDVDDEPQPTSAMQVLLDEHDATSDKTHLVEQVEQTRPPSPEIEEKSHVPQEEQVVVEELERAFDPSGRSQIVSDSEEEEEEEEEEEAKDSDEEGEEKEMFDSAALAALLKAATSGAHSDSSTITVTSQDGSRLFSVERPAGLGSSLRSVRPASRPSNSSLLTPSRLVAPSEENLSEEDKKKMQLIHQLRVKFLRLVHRLGHTAEDSMAAQVLYRLALLAGRPTTPAFSLENAKQTAMQLEGEEQGNDDLDFSLNILVLGKTGVGKSATINSIFGEEKVKINAFEPETCCAQEINGTLDGVKVKVIDAPGLKSSGMEQGFNRKVLASMQKLTKKYPPDIMLYVDRLDSQTRDLNDFPLLRTITSSLGTSIWRSAIVTLTHASCAPPDGPSGSPLSYEVFVAQRSHIVQQSIGQAVGDMRLMNPSLMNPVSLVENHPACRKNREGQRVLPNGQAWRSQLLLLCYSLKILSEANSASKPQDPFDHRKIFGFRVRSVPLPYLLSTMLQPRVHPKLSADQGGDNGDSDIDLEDLSDSDQEEEGDEYDQLPPFKPLRKAQIAKLSRDQRKAYFEEYDYRVKLLQRKQWREELKRMREMKKKDDYGEMPDDFDPENGDAPAAVPVALPDMVLPPSFDSDNPAYRYRFLEPTSQFLARPVLDTHGWDHDCGYDGVNVEQNLGIANRFPAAVAVQVTKDKKEFNIHLDSGVSAKHGETGSSLLGFDIQTLGKQLAYTVRGETKFRNFLKKKNKTGGGVSVTFLGENVATGLKLEDQISVGKRLVLLGSSGVVRSQKDAAYGANLEVRLREVDYPIGQDQSSVHVSLMKWRGDLAVGGNLQSQISVGRSSKMAVRVSLNNKLSGQISVKTSSSDHLQLALAGLLPIALSIYRNFRPGTVSDNYSLY